MKVASSIFALSACLTIFTVSCQSHSIQQQDDQEHHYWNNVESALMELVSNLVQTNGSFLIIDDFSDTFGGGFLKGKFIANDGLIGNFSTVQIVNLTVSTTNDSLTISVDIKLNHLEIFYKSVHVSALFLSVGGSVSVVVQKNLLNAQVTITLKDDDCEASLDILKLKEFGDIELDFTNMGGSFNENIMEKAAKLIINKFDKELQYMAEEKLYDMAIKYLDKVCTFVF